MLIRILKELKNKKMLSKKDVEVLQEMWSGLDEVLDADNMEQIF